MNTNRVIAVSGLVLAVLLLVAGSNVEYGAKAYRFPNIIAYILAGFAIIMLLAEGGLLVRGNNVPAGGPSAGSGIKKIYEAIKSSDFFRLLPMFAIILAYLYLADIVGLYTCSFAAFLAIVTIYAPAELTIKAFTRYMLVSILFVGVIYMVFSWALQLQAPPAYLV
ncbi:tripartite tricarboxylate transporter TctB family protein [Marinobacterium rhizophilum]|uniref:Tripartite tricarboxylate transporter TctB family protein n=1 Tax=Marinobacterium rhizophilum TaxID=420402 RepID=A0ABY5HGQ6_9GAMM|nr:tripartite tricarboxylate transporter TctB family protein [Marinobacterium rhizophilum]UTW11548.1 tripartite tricarboxylate transporter TctB family protein [Marinobacterium rhizophilum]